MTTESIYRVVANPEWSEAAADREYRWQVVDEDGSVCDETDDRADADRWAAEASAIAVECVCEERRDAIRELVDGCTDPALLARVEALLREGR